MYSGRICNNFIKNKTCFFLCLGRRQALSHLRVYVAFVQQLPRLHQVHLSLRRWHRCGDYHPVLAPLVPERHRADFRAAPSLGNLLLVQLETVQKQEGRGQDKYY